MYVILIQTNNNIIQNVISKRYNFNLYTHFLVHMAYGMAYMGTKIMIPILMHRNMHAAAIAMKLFFISFLFILSLIHI